MNQVCSRFLQVLYFHCFLRYIFSITHQLTGSNNNHNQQNRQHNTMHVSSEIYIHNNFSHMQNTVMVRGLAASTATCN